MPSTKQTPHLAVGQFDGGQVVNSVRGYFLWRIQKEVPLVSIQLRDEVLNLFLRTKQNANPQRLSSTTAEQLRTKVLDGTIESQDVEYLRNDFAQGQFGNDRHFSVFLNGLFDWSTRWNLDADWFLFRALRTLNSWGKNKIFRDNLQWSSQLYGAEEPEGEPQPPAGFPAWNVFDDSAKVYLSKVENLVKQRIADDDILSRAEASHRRAFIRHLVGIAKDYQVRVRRFYNEQGYKPANQQELLKHIEWTVFFQVQKKSCESIASGFSVSEQAVNKAVKSILLLMEFNRRKITKGRPQGSKESQKRRRVDRKKSVPR